MMKVLYALLPTLDYLLRIRAQTLFSKELSKAKRDEYVKAWSEATLQRLKVYLTTQGKPTKKPCIFVGNHISYVDIPVILSQVSATFLAKKELSRWPIIGGASHAVGTLFVDRQSGASRSKNVKLIVQRILKHRDSIVVFPSGTTSVDENVPWRLGAFRIAAEHKIPIQAFRIRYTPASTAFIGEDAFLPHMYQLLKHPKIKASIEFQAPKIIKHAEQGLESIKTWCMKH